MRVWVLLAAFGLFVPVSASLAGELVPLDKDFSFRLDTTAPSAPSFEPCPEKSAPMERERPDAPKTPQGERLPPGTREHQFNGQPYYVIPLNA